MSTWRADACNSLTHRAGTGLEYAGRGAIYAGLTIAAISGPGNAGPGLFITSAGSYLSTGGQVLQDIAFADVSGVPRAFVNLAGGRFLTAAVPPSVRNQFGDSLVGAGTVDAAGYYLQGAYVIDWLDPDRC